MEPIDDAVFAILARTLAPVPSERGAAIAFFVDRILNEPLSVLLAVADLDRTILGPVAEYMVAVAYHYTDLDKLQPRPRQP